MNVSISLVLYLFEQSHLYTYQKLNCFLKDLFTLAFLEVKNIILLKVMKENRKLFYASVPLVIDKESALEITMYVI